MLLEKEEICLGDGRYLYTLPRTLVEVSNSPSLSAKPPEVSLE